MPLPRFLRRDIPEREPEPDPEPASGPISAVLGEIPKPEPDPPAPYGWWNFLVNPETGERQWRPITDDDLQPRSARDE